MGQKKKSDYIKMIAGIFLCLCSLSIGQIVQVVLQEKINEIPGLYGLGNIISGIAYIGVVFFLLMVINKKVLHLSMESCRMNVSTLKGKWLLAGILLPVIVLGIMLCFPGEFMRKEMTGKSTFFLITNLIFVLGLGGGIVEEMIFRGVMLTAIEKKLGRRWAIIITSVIFGAGHIAAAGTNVMAAVMILIAGIMVGVMFSAVTYESGSIWNSAFIHGIWNAVILGGIVNISTIPDESSIVSYVLEERFAFLNGGYINIEPSLISIIGYAIISIYAITSMQKAYRKKGC